MFMVCLDKKIKIKNTINKIKYSKNNVGLIFAFGMGPFFVLFCFVPVYFSFLESAATLFCYKTLWTMKQLAFHLKGGEQIMTE